MFKISGYITDKSKPWYEIWKNIFINQYFQIFYWYFTNFSKFSCGEEQASELWLLCLEQIWMHASGSSLVFQWCGCSGNFLNGAIVLEILPRVWLHHAPPKVASPQGYECTCACFPMVQLHLIPLEKMVLLLLKGETAFSYAKKNHHFLISFLWCSWCFP